MSVPPATNAMVQPSPGSGLWAKAEAIEGAAPKLKPRSYGSAPTDSTSRLPLVTFGATFSSTCCM